MELTPFSGESDPTHAAIERVLHTMDRHITPFEEKTITALRSRGEVDAGIEVVRQLGPAVHVGGMIDSEIEVDAAFLTFPGRGVVEHRVAGGLLHSIEAPTQPGDPVRFHFAESKRSHAATADALGLAPAHTAAIGVPTKRGPKAEMGALYYADYPDCANILIFFSDEQKTGRTIVDRPTMKSVASALLNTVGRSLLERLPQADAVMYFLCFGDDTSVETIQRHQLLEKGITAEDIVF